MSRSRRSLGSRSVRSALHAAGRNAFSAGRKLRMEPLEDRRLLSLVPQLVADVDLAAHAVSAVGSSPEDTLRVVSATPQADCIDITFNKPVDLATFTPEDVSILPDGGVELPWRRQLSGSIRDVDVVGTYAYVATGPGLAILDLSSPAEPRWIGDYDTPGQVYDVAVVGDLAYVADYSFGLEILNIADPAAPSLVGSYNTPGLASGVSVIGSLAYVADGDSGLKILNVADPAAPSLVGSYDTPGSAKEVAVLGDLAYVADYSSGLKILSVANPAAPSLVGSYDTPGYAWDIAVAGRVAYVADDTFGLEIVNVTNPAMPNLVWNYDTPGYANGVSVVGDLAYIADSSSGLAILNIANPAAPSLVGSCDTPGYALDVAVLGDLAYVADLSSDLQILNIANPAAPSRAGSFEIGNPRSVTVVGDLAYVAGGSCGLKILNIADPAAPSFVGSCDTPGQAYEVTVVGDLAYVADYTSGLQILNVANPSAPSLVGSYDTPGSAGGVSVAGDLAYVADGASGLEILDVSNPASPRLVASYDTPGSALDVTVIGGLAYVADDHRGLRILNIANPAAPSLVGDYDTYDAYSVSVVGDLAYVADGQIGGLQILDVSNPARPSLVGSYNTVGEAYSVSVVGDLAYVADGQNGGLEILDVSNPAAPGLVGNYDTPGQAYGVTVVGDLVLVADGGSLQVLRNFAAVSSISQVGAATYRLHLGGPLADGGYNLAVGPRITDTSGLPMDQDEDGQLGEFPNDAFRMAWWSGDYPSGQFNLSSTQVAENQMAGALVGSFSIADPDAVGPFTYTLVPGTGSTGNGFFTIDADGNLKTAWFFNYETRNRYSIRVHATDAGGLQFEQPFTIRVGNVNETPTVISLSASTVTENLPSGTFVGAFTASDPDAGDTFTYALVSGTGSTDNGSFTIDASGNLKTAAPLDSDAKYSLSILVRATDAGGLWRETAFTIYVRDVNETPTDISLSRTTVPEHVSIGTTVGTLSTTDPDAVRTFAYTLVSGAGDTDNGSFTIDSSGNLKTAATFDYEGKNSYSIRIRTTDPGGLWCEEFFTITVANVNESPTNLSLSASNIAENQPAGTLVGSLSTSDPDLGDTFAYTLVSGTGSADNGSFTIDAGGNLRTAASFDYETKNSYSIRVHTADAAGWPYEKPFTIDVNNVNETPANLGLSANVVAEDQPAGAVVGSFSCSDPDAGDMITYTLVSGAGSTDNTSFWIGAGGQLRTAASFDYETKGSYSIRARATDAAGLWSEKAFTLAVIKALPDEPPRVMSVAPQAEYIDITFNESVDRSTFTPEDVSILPDHGVELEPFGQIGGGFVDVEVVGNYAYAATGLGLAVLDVSNPQQPRCVGNYDTPSAAQGVSVAGDLACVVDASYGLHIFNIADPTLPRLVGRYGLPDGAYDVSLVGDLAYVAHGASGLEILDIADPAAPRLLGSYDTTGAALGLSLVGDLAYVADGADVVILDIANPAAPRFVGTYDTPGSAHRVSVVGDLAYVADHTSLQILNVANPAALSFVGSYDTTGRACDVTVVGDLAYVADYTSGFEILNIANPAAPSLVGSCDTTGAAQGVTVVGDLAYVADGNDLLVLSLADPARPSRVGSYDSPFSVFGVSVVGDLAYVPVSAFGLQIFSIADPTAPRLVGNHIARNGVCGVSVLGDFAYLACGTFDLEILNIANPAAPTLVRRFQMSGVAHGVAAVGNFLYVVDEYDPGLQIYSIADPAAPSLVGTYYMPDYGGGYGVSAVGDLVYLVGYSGLEIVNVANPAAPSLLARYDTVRTAYGVSVVGDLAYLAEDEAGLEVLNIANPAAPTLVGSYATPNRAYGVATVGDLVYVADGNSLRILRNAAAVNSISQVGVATYRLELRNPLADGGYTLTVGSQITDPAGWLMDQDQDDQLGEFPDDAFRMAWWLGGSRPEDISLSSSNVAENQPAGSLVGSFSTTDADVGDTFTYSLVTGTGSTDNGSFTIDTGGNLKTSLSFNFERRNSYSIRVRTTDSEGLWYEKPFTINVTDGNEAPTDIGLSASSVLEYVLEYEPFGTVVGSFSTVDPDASDSFVYTLVAGDGSDDNGSFEIDAGGNLWTIAWFDYTMKDWYSVRVRSTDAAGLWYEKAFTIAVVASWPSEALHVISATPQPEYVDVTFNKPLDLSTFTPDDVSVLPYAGVELESICELGGEFLDVQVVGTYAYAATRLGLTILDISNPAQPRWVGSYDTPGNAGDVAVIGDLAYVADGPAGLQILNVANPAAPSFVGSYDTPGDARGVSVAGNLAYVADCDSGLQILNVANPAAPSLVGSYDTPGNALCVAVVGSLAYVADDYRGIQILNVENPAAPSLAGSCDTPGTAESVTVVDDFAYVADGTSGLEILNIASPAAPTLVGSYDTSGAAQVVTIAGNLAYVADRTSGLEILNIASPAAPSFVGSYDTPGDALSVGVVGDLAYVADSYFGLQILNVADPANPSVMGSYDTPGRSYGVAVMGDLAYVAADTFGLRIYSIADPAAPRLVGSCDTPGRARDVTIVGDLAYVADGTSGLQIINVASPAAPSLVGAYDTPVDAIRVSVSGDLACVADYRGLQILNIADPTAPSLVGDFFGQGYIESVAVVGDVAYVAGWRAGLYIVNIANPATPSYLGGWGMNNHVYDVTVLGALAYLATDSGLSILNIANPASPYLVGTYSSPGDAQRVTVLGDLAYMADGAYGLRVLNVANPAAPTLVGSYNTPDYAYEVSVVGDLACVADGSGLQIFRNSVAVNSVFQVGVATWRLELGSALPDGGYTLAVGFQVADPAGRLMDQDQDGQLGEFPDDAFRMTWWFGNQPPSELSLSSSQVVENQPAGTLVGTLSTTDLDVGDTFTYSFASGTGNVDNGSFTMDPSGRLLTAASFDFDVKSSYSIRVRTTDNGGLWCERPFTISVTNVNETPTNIGLSASSVREQQPIGTVVGSFSTTDPDVGDTFAYALAVGSGSADNASFTIDSGGRLLTAASFDFELKNSYSIRVRTTDSGGLWYERPFTISVSNINEAPTNINLSGNYVGENQAVGTLVGAFSTSDPDVGNTFTYWLVSGAGSTDNSSFTIATGGNLKTAASFNYEAKSSYSIRVRTTDAGGLWYEKAFTINVYNINETPTDISLSASSLAEGQPAGTIVGTFSAIDPDVGETFAYALVSGTGSADNGSFTIDASGNLRTAASLDYETKTSYAIRVRTNDAGGLPYEESFTVTVTNINEPPGDILLSAGNVTENLPVGTVVGSFGTADPDLGDTITYTLVSGDGDDDNTLFTIDGDGNLLTAAIFDHQAQSACSIRIRASDAAGLWYEKAFTISIVMPLRVVSAAPQADCIDVTFNQPVNLATFTPEDVSILASGGVELQWIGQLGGEFFDVEVVGNYAYAAAGPVLAILDISNPAQPRLTGSYPTPNSAQDVTVVGDLAYVAEGASGLRILDIANPAAPSLVGSYDTPGYAFGVTVAGDRAYVADSSSGLEILNVANPATPSLLGSYDTPGTAYGVTVVGERAYVADAGSGLLILNVANPASPSRVGGYDTPGSAREVTVVGDLVYVADGGGLLILTVADPILPTFVGSYDTPGEARGVSVVGDLAYVADYNSGVQVLNVAQPSAPNLVGSWDTPGNACGVSVVGDLVYVADYISGLEILNVADPAAPSLVGSYDTPGNTRSVSVVGDLAYVAGETLGLQILNVANPAAPALVGRYDTPGQAYTVSIVGDFAYVADVSSFLILNIADPAAPRLVGSYATPSHAYGATVVGDLAYVVSQTNRMQILNIADPAMPSLVADYGIAGHTYDVCVVGDLAYVAVGDAGLRILNVANPAGPTLVGSYDTPGNAMSVSVVGSLAYVADNASGLQILNIANPAAPSLVGSCDTPDHAFDVTVVGSLAYVADDASGLQIFDVANPAAPNLVGSYNTPYLALMVSVLGELAYVADGLAGLQILRNPVAVDSISQIDAATYRLQLGGPLAAGQYAASVGPQIADAAGWLMNQDQDNQAGELPDDAFRMTWWSEGSPPSDIDLSAGEVAENQPAATLVGRLSTSDPDPGDTFTYSLASGDGDADNGSFTIDAGGNLLTAAPFDYETKDSYSIRVRTTDAAGLWYEATFTITVTNIDELAPTVTGVLVNGGMVDPSNLASKGSQPTGWVQERSDLRTIVVTFSEPVAEVTAANLVLVNLGVNAPVDPDAFVSLADPQLTLSENNTKLSVSFSPYQLADGVYRLEVLPTVTDLAGNPIDGDGTGGDRYVFQGNATNRFYKLAGDFNGSGGVNIQDLATLAYWFGQPVPTAPAYADMNNSGGVNIQDLAPYAANFQKAVTYPLPAQGGQSLVQSKVIVGDWTQPPVTRPQIESPAAKLQETAAYPPSARGNPSLAQSTVVGSDSTRSLATRPQLASSVDLLALEVAKTTSAAKKKVRPSAANLATDYLIEQGIW